MTEETWTPRRCLLAQINALMAEIEVIEREIERERELALAERDRR